MIARFAAWRFRLVLALLLPLSMIGQPTGYNGDVVEYTLDTVALATHGSADIRLPDIARARELVPTLAVAYDALAADMQAGRQKVYPAFVRGREGKVYSVHFFGYSALATIPYKVLETLHRSPFRAFQLVNLAAVFVLGLALRRFFGSDLKALAGVALFMLCGGTAYVNWASPECMSAAGLLSGLLLFWSGAPAWGALAAGIAAQQNPTIAVFFGFAPLLLVLRHYSAGTSLADSVRAVLTRRNVAGLALGAAVFALPMLFSLYQWGVPNIIAKLYSDPTLMGLVRLVSFYFDLNQGMILAVPAVAVALLAWGWGRGHEARSNALVLAACVLFTLALAVPTLAVLNWNSDAAGVMRYGFWAAMPLVFALLVRLSGRARWPAALVLPLAVVQAAAMDHAQRYSYVEFSPAARMLLARAPGLYHPEPEIFAERNGHVDSSIQPDRLYVYAVDGRPVKTLVNVANPRASELLCGSDRVLAPDNRYVDSTRGWRYIDGPPRCISDGTPRRSFMVDQFKTGAGIRLASGWHEVEHDPGTWGGVWSDGARSRLVLATEGINPHTLAMFGHYLEGNRRTRVIVNGQDLGMHQLDQEGPLALPAGTGQAAMLEVILEHEAPHLPGNGDPRTLAFFLKQVELRAAAATAEQAR
ncbi:hypothetical protein [Massilia horti]|uniref:Uncharacterized protein n=1 Tax=Massilia horti TaxID=2562153 RepID=A0A4Y9SYG5_9BURK|nr:hypothetical protein [Massilia horti]TFW30409.1 hypothetical protein E4O92_17135 [Massilia horti]